MPRVFLSHSSQDKEFVRHLADSLEDAGADVWLDERKIDFGDNIVNALQSGLDRPIVILVLSPDSVASPWVTEEWTATFWDQVNQGKVNLIPVLYRDCEIPPFLRNKMYRDARHDEEQAIQQLAKWFVDKGHIKR